MRLLLDSCIPSVTCEEILRKGHDVNWVKHWGKDPGDKEILRVAHEQSRILVTLDKDFGQLATIEGMGHCGILLLRRLRITRQAPRCLEALEEFRDQLLQGAIVIVEPGRTRCHQH